MRLFKRLVELAFVIFVISLFMKNKDLELQIAYFGLDAPIKVAFWELVTFCVSIGIIIAAIGDFVTQIKWMREKRRMTKTDRGHNRDVERLNQKIQELETENERVKSNLETKDREVSDLRQQMITCCETQGEARISEPGGPPESAEKK